MKLGTNKHRAALAACTAWSLELGKVFGRRAGDARYRPEGKGEPGTPLRHAADAFTVATTEWENDQ